ncbi:MAG: CAP domain-containing protein, partial [Chloroflexota bacterium]|nr:CAP domain-containing protein [Chloroflexota bacterium]
MFVRTAFAAGLVAALLLGAAPAAATIVPTGPASAASAQSDLQVLVNQYRAANGLQTVSLNGALSSSASWMAADMAAKNYFSHTSSDGLSPAQRMAGAGYPAYTSYTGEDLAAGFAGAA